MKTPITNQRPKTTPKNFRKVIKALTPKMIPITIHKYGTYIIRKIKTINNSKPTPIVSVVPIDKIKCYSDL